VPEAHALQTSETPAPALAKPLRQAQVVAPAVLLLPVGHATQTEPVALATAYVFAGQMLQARVEPKPEVA
jgi:hypothetical protein